MDSSSAWVYPKTVSNKCFALQYSVSQIALHKPSMVSILLCCWRQQAEQLSQKVQETV